MTPLEQRINELEERIAKYQRQEDFLNWKHPFEETPPLSLSLELQVRKTQILLLEGRNEKTEEYANQLISRAGLSYDESARGLAKESVKFCLKRVQEQLGDLKERLRKEQAT